MKMLRICVSEAEDELRRSEMGFRSINRRKQDDDWSFIFYNQNSEFNTEMGHKKVM